VLPFKVHHLEILGKHYLLLPKLNDRQMGILKGRLKRNGFSVLQSPSIIARSAKGTIHVDPSGLCWGYSDPEDLLLPAIPELLSCPKQVIPMKAMESLYFRSNGSSARIVTRLESGTLWEHLRATGDCGLTPDERAVALEVVGEAGAARLVADYAGSTPKLYTFGHRRYFETAVNRAEAESTLRCAGELRAGNSYLPNDGSLGLRKGFLPHLRETFSNLGDWCYFTPR
jgi:hypothetical protein